MTTDAMRVSFIVGLYNCLPLTREMLRSLQSSLPGDLDYEIIFIDDLSTDDTRSWLKTLKAPCRYSLNEKNYGYAASNNRGALIATGDICIFLNNDLVFTKGWLEPLLKTYTDLGSNAGVIGNVQRDIKTGLIDHAGIYINSKGKPAHLKTAPIFSTLFNLVLRNTLSTGACFLISKTLWIKLNGFNESYMNSCEDIDLGLRARKLGKINAVCLGSQIYHHISQSPGRKSRDEFNSYTLTLTWNATLAELSLKDWCKNYFETYLSDPRDYPNASLARKIALYLIGLKRTPPHEALLGAHHSLEIELKRWKEMFKSE